ncbi:MAG: hypothetical protein J6Y28_07895 [Acholeplasmatales bacterium]|nr:hypothetical protein [Acholeplasmatales bacterium]
MRDLSKIVEVLKSYGIESNELYSSSGMDETELIYDEDGVELYYCSGYCYMDVLGLTDEEFKELKKIMSEVHYSWND